MNIPDVALAWTRRVSPFVVSLSNFEAKGKAPGYATTARLTQATRAAGPFDCHLTAWVDWHAGQFGIFRNIISP